MFIGLICAQGYCTFSLQGNVAERLHIGFGAANWRLAIVGNGQQQTIVISV
jgi:hypothetical protein